MADLDRPLAALVDPPLAEPPGMDDLQRRAHALRRRDRVRKGGLAAAAALVVVAGAVALIPGDKPQTVRTAAPPSGSGAAAGGTGQRVDPAVPAAGAEPITVLLRTFELAGQEWRVLAIRTAEPPICFTIQSRAGEEIKPACLTPDARMVQAAAADLGGGSFVYGIVAPDVTTASIIVDGNVGRLDLLGQGTGFPVNFVGTPVPATASNAQVTAIRGERDESASVAVSLPVHRRAASINGEQAAPTTAVAPAAPAPDRSTTTQPTTLPPDTPVSTIVNPPPGTTPPPSGGSPKRVEVTPGTTQLHKHAFESAFASGAQSVAVRFWGGVEPCETLGRVDVVETAERVTITLWTGIGPGAEAMACIAIAQYKETIVALSAPLGGRTIVDGAA